MRRSAFLFPFSRGCCRCSHPHSHARASSPHEGPTRAHSQASCPPTHPPSSPTPGARASAKAGRCTTCRHFGTSGLPPERVACAAQLAGSTTRSTPRSRTRRRNRPNHICPLCRAPKSRCAHVRHDAHRDTCAQHDTRIRSSLPGAAGVLETLFQVHVQQGGPHARQPHQDPAAQGAPERRWF